MDEKTFDTLWNPDDLPRTEEDLRMLNLKVKATGNPYLLVQLLARVGRAQGLQKRLEQAMDTLNEADFVLLQAAQKDTAEHAAKHRAWIRYMIERGRLFSIAGWDDSAQRFLEDAFQMARDLNHFDLFKESLETIRSLGLAVPVHPAGDPPSSP